MTEAAINAGFWRDIYLALGDKVDDNAWAVRIQYKAFVRWIWLGAIFMAAGGVIAILDPRYRKVLAPNKNRQAENSVEPVSRINETAIAGTEIKS